MGRLAIISNRVANLQAETQSGGLAVALRDALTDRGGIWFGWNGEMGESREPPREESFGHVSRVGLPLTERDYREYYLGYSNSVLWPLFHYRLDLVDYRTAFFEGYVRVNRDFARQIVPFLKPDDTIWVHDYHLIPLARHLRQLGCTQKIGFFLHIPFPPPDMLSASPNHEALVKALTEYDLIGFQSNSDVANLKHYLQDYGGVEDLGEDRFKVGDRTVRYRRFPIGIDAEVFAGMAEDAPEDVGIDAMRRKILGRRQIIGVDRLDYSKGLPERMKAFSRLLSSHPELEKAVTFLQIAPPTREEVNAYSDIRDELEGLAGSINGKFADFNWTPVHYIHRSVPREKLAPLFRASQVGFVTPLRDGMNLVAKEYVAAQDPEDPGVLILSQFAGAAEEMREALIVNPYDVQEMSRSLYNALNMPLDERRDRHRALAAHVTEQNSRVWLEDFISVLEGGAGEGASSGPRLVANG